MTIPHSVTSIGGSAFQYCAALTSVTIPDNVTSIGNYAFNGCSRLTSIIVSSGNPSYSSQDEVLFNKDKTVLICCPGGKSEDYVIPGSVTSIGDSAFELCSNLTNIIIPNSITKIGESAFNGCSSLLNITIPDSVTSIYGSAFYNCSSLISVTIPDSVKRIRAYTFDGCSNLTSVTLPKDVTSIEYCTFYNCSSLTSVTIPASVTRIMEKAFDGCSALRDVIYGGSEEQWNSVSISDDNDPILNATIHYSDNTYIVSFNANGGTDAPANQTKTQGVTMTLSSLKPSKKYVINYNANGGSVSPTSKTVECTFKNWNTKTPHVSTQT